MDIAAILLLKDYRSTQPLDSPYRICQMVSDKMSFENVDKLRRMTNDGRLKMTQPAYSIIFLNLDSGEQRTSDCQNNTHLKIFFKKAILNLLEFFLYQGQVVLLSVLH